MEDWTSKAKGCDNDNIEDDTVNSVTYGYFYEQNELSYVTTTK